MDTVHTRRVHHEARVLRGRCATADFTLLKRLASRVKFFKLKEKKKISPLRGFTRFR